VKILFSKYWRKRFFVFGAGAALAVSLAAVLWLPGVLRNRFRPVAAPGDLLMEQMINNRIALPALQGNPAAIMVMADICLRIEKDPAAAMQYLRYGAMSAAADRKIFEQVIYAAGYTLPERRDTPELRMYLRRFAAFARCHGDPGLAKRLEQRLMDGGRRK